MTMNKGVLPIPEDEQWKLFILILQEIANEKKITQLEIARRTGLAHSNVNRLFTLKYTPSLAMFLKICRAVGVNIFIESKDSDTDFNQLFERAMTELGRRPDRLPKN
jgi:transcriptional regulator with XRE-family HTH domain